MFDNKNTILAIVLSAIVLIGWQYFIGMPQLEKQKQEAALKAQQQAQVQTTTPAPNQPAGQQGTPGGAPAQLPGQGGAPTAGQERSREQVIASSPRIKIETPRISGSIALKGAAIDDVELTQYRETIDPNSPPI